MDRDPQGPPVSPSERQKGPKKKPTALPWVSRGGPHRDGTNNETALKLNRLASCAATAFPLAAPNGPSIPSHEDISAPALAPASPITPGGRMFKEEPRALDSPEVPSLSTVPPALPSGTGTILISALPSPEPSTGSHTSPTSVAEVDQSENRDGNAEVTLSGAGTGQAEILRTTDMPISNGTVDSETDRTADPPGAEQRNHKRPRLETWTDSSLPPPPSQRRRRQRPRGPRRPPPPFRPNRTLCQIPARDRPE